MLASGPGDPHGLDGSDNDGRACESNPCPSGTTAPQPLVGGTSAQDDTPAPVPPAAVVRRNVGNVVKVTDGDTLKVRVRGVGVRDIRIISIDTPEVYGGAECGGRRASQRMRELAPAEGMWRLVQPREVAETVWRAYHEDILHWYIPEELREFHAQVVATPEQVRTERTELAKMMAG